MEEKLKKVSKKKIKSESKSNLSAKRNLKLNLKKSLSKNLFTKNNSLSLFSKSLADEKWGEIQKDMSKAISHWDDVTKKYDGKPSRDDQQMQEIKKLLKDLQKKLTNFG